MSSTRRTFLGVSAAAAATARARAAPARISEVRLSTIEGNFHKFVAMNSQDDEPKGTTYTNTLVQIATDAGPEGIGVMSYPLPDRAYLAALEHLLGADPESVYEFRDGVIAGRAAAYQELLTTYKHLDGALCDLIGKLRGVPCWQLFGESVRDRVEVYDGTLYFSDLWYRERGVQAVVDEAREAVSSGYRGVKLKIGRGDKWMGREEGLRRDIEVIRAVRSAIGMERKVLVDANNGYSGLDETWQMLEATADQRVDWLEEPFPEDRVLYGELRRRMRSTGIATPIADGENLRSAADFGPYLEPEKLFDFLQLDIRTGGILDCREMAAMGQPHGAAAVPHNWGSQVGLLMSLHLARTQPNIAGAEDDRSTCPALVTNGYTFADGHYTVSDQPGLGVALNEAFYEAPLYPKQTVVR